MQFNQFRILLTLLVSMGPFFAYICKLNLSLTVENMVIKRPPNESDSSTDCSRDSVYDYYADIASSSYMEDHALAALSSKSISNWRLNRMLRNRAIERCKLRSESLISLSVEENSSQVNEQFVNFDLKNQRESINSTTTIATTIRTISRPVVASTTSANSDAITEVINDTGTSYLLDWSKKEKDFLLSAYFIGYVVAQVPVARMAEVLGAKPVFIAVGLGTAICSLIFPFTCYLSVATASFVRVLLGAFQAGMFPSAYVLLCEWLPKNERSKWLPWPAAFSRFGTIAMYLLVPIIVTSGGWEWVFYISGGATLIWTLLFMVLGSNSPNQSFWISKSELIHIESHMEPRIGTLNQQSTITASGFTINELPLAKPAISWRRITTNRALLVLTLVMFTSEWSNMLLLVKLPGFLGPVLKLDLGEIGIWSSVLILVFCIMYPVSGFFASKLEASNIEGLDSLKVRKVFEISAHAFQALGSVIIALSCDKSTIAGALILLMFGRSLVGGGQCLMPPELSKDYPGTVFAYANSLANLAGFFGPNLLTLMVDNPEQHSSWSSMWLLSALIFITGGVLFCLFAENSPQNYCKKPAARTTTNLSLSQAQLTNEAFEPEIFKLESFARVTSEPKDSSEAGNPISTLPDISLSGEAFKGRRGRRRLTRL